MVSHRVVALCGRQLAWKICNLLTRLLKYSSNVGIGCVHPHHKRLIKNRDTKDWGTCECSLETVKCRLLNSRKAQNLTFPKKVQQRGSNMCEVVHILAIVVAPTKELLHMSDTGRSRPLTNSWKLGWVHADLAIANYVVQVVDLTVKKYTFLHLCI